jgi:hypothetical protein
MSPPAKIMARSPEQRSTFHESVSP